MARLILLLDGAEPTSGSEDCESDGQESEAEDDPLTPTAAAPTVDIHDEDMESDEFAAAILASFATQRREEIATRHAKLPRNETLLSAEDAKGHLESAFISSNLARAKGLASVTHARDTEEDEAQGSGTAVFSTEEVEQEQGLIWGGW